jgi:hypothetical protein
MFHLQPGQGLGGEPSRQLSFGLGGGFDVTVPVPFDPDPAGGFDRFRSGEDYLARAHQEDEELLLMARAFIEIIQCR